MKAGFGRHLLLPVWVCAALPAMTAEISFDYAANSHIPDSAILNRYFSARLANDDQQTRVIAARNLIEELRQTIPNTDMEEVSGKEITQTPLSVRPAGQTRPENMEFFATLGMEYSSGYLYVAVGNSPLIVQSRPRLEIFKDEFFYSLVLSTCYLDPNVIKAGNFSWPVSLNMAGFKDSQMVMEVNYAPARAVLDSRAGIFELNAQGNTLEGSAFSLVLSGNLKSGERRTFSAIDPQLSLKLGEASEERSNAELSIILPGNGDSDIAGQFHNFRTDSTARDKILVIGQFSSAPETDK